MKKTIILVALIITYFSPAQNKVGQYHIKNLNINTKYADFGTAYLGEDKVVFSSPKKLNRIIRNIWKPNSQPYLDLFIGTIDSTSGDIINKQKVRGNINLKFHEAQVAFSRNGKTVYFTGNNFYNNEVKNDSTGTLRLQLFKASVDDNGEWINVEKLPFNSDEFSTGHPTLSKDGKLLYFVSDRPGSIGKSDIYYVTVNDDETYGVPVNLGTKVNTEEKEMFPFISDDNILYFSSSGHPGNGELDIFASRILNNSISKPINIGAPINSEKDDFAFIIEKNKGYFSSNRDGGKGDDDIYAFLVSSPLKIDCNQPVTGVVRNKETQELIPGATVFLMDAEGNKLDEILVSDAAAYTFTVPCNTSFTLEVKVPGFLPERTSGTTANSFDANILETAISIEPELKRVNDKVIANINTIYFDLDKWEIREDAAIELNKVIAVLNEYPSIKIEAISHTDSRANDQYNQKLSERRAKATVDYIIANGIHPDRLKYKGLGESELVNKCSNNTSCSEDEHQKNRRTEFIVIQN